MKNLTLAAIVVVALASRMPAHSLELSGILAPGGAEETLIVATDTAAKKSSAWLRVGSEWNGYRVAAIDPKTESARFVRGAETIVVRLRGSMVRGAKPEDGVATVVVPVLAKGTYRLSEGKLVYSADAVVKFGEFTVTSHNGNMVSDGCAIVGDLTVETAAGKTVVNGGSVSMKNGRPNISGKSLKVFPKGNADQMK